MSNEERTRGMSIEGMSAEKVVIYILYAIALAMGVATVVLSQLGEPLTTFIPLLGIGMFALAVAGLTSVEN